MIRPISLALLAGLSVLAGAARADQAPVRVEASLHDGKTRYLVGEPIVVDLQVTAIDDPVVIDQTSDEARMSIDQIEITPTEGVYAWRTDSERFAPRWGDTYTVYPATREFTTRLTLNRRFRFDAEGTYTIRIVTGRVRPAATSNVVTFNVTRPSAAEEVRRAAELDQAIRNAPDERSAGRLATQIDWLTDDAATEVKLGLLVAPRSSDRYFRHDRIGLWVAKNRERVIARLEQAIVDPDEDIPMGSGLLETLVSLKVAQEIPDPRDANVPMAPRRGDIWEPGPLEKETSDIRAGYIHAIATTLPSRTGRSRIDAAQHVMRSKDRSQALMDDADFRAARDVVIAHFEDIDAYNVDTELDSYGKYFTDVRMIPAFHRVVDAPARSVLASSRPYALKILSKIEPAFVAALVIHSACTAKPLPIEVDRDLAVETLPAIDDCLQTRMTEGAREPVTGLTGSSLDRTTLPYVARFATARLLPAVDAYYRSIADDPRHRQAAGASLTYLMRWAPQQYRPLLEAAAPAAADGNGISWQAMTAVAFAPTDGIRSYFRDRVTALPIAGARTYVYALGEVADAADRPFLEQQLAALLTSRQPSTVPSKEQTQMETALLDVLKRIPARPTDGPQR